MFVQASPNFHTETQKQERSEHVSSVCRSRMVGTCLPPTLPPRCRNVKAVSEGWESRLQIFVDSLQIRGTVWLKSAFRAKRRGFPAI